MLPRKREVDMIRRSRGFTLVELMITVTIVAIGVALALPSWKFFVEKRQLTAAAEEVASFVSFARGAAVKRNQIVTVSWMPGADFCMGISAPPQTAPCNCSLDIDNTVVPEKICSVGSVPYIISNDDFGDISQEFMVMQPTTGSFGFDPIRGTIVNETPSAEIYNGDYLFKVQSKEIPDTSDRLFALKFRLNPTGHLTICAETDQVLSRIGAYPTC